MCTHLLEGKDVLVEVKLDLLVGDVDAQLLKRVLLEVLEAEDVQDSHVHAALRSTSKPSAARRGREEKKTNKKRGQTNLFFCSMEEGESPAQPY